MGAFRNASICPAEIPASASAAPPAGVAVVGLAAAAAAAASKRFLDGAAGAGAARGRAEGFAEAGEGVPGGPADAGGADWIRADSGIPYDITITSAADP